MDYTLIVNKSRKAAKSSVTTYIIAFIVATAVFIIINQYGLSEEQQPEVTIVLVGVVIFFGVLVISAHHNHTTEEGKHKHATGTMRRAIAASIVMVYLITFSITTFGDFQDKTIEDAKEEMSTELTKKIKGLIKASANNTAVEQTINATLADKLPEIRQALELELFSKKTLLGHFTTVTSLVIIFYFGSKAVENIFKKNETSNMVDKKSVKKGIDDIIKKIDSKANDAKKDLQTLSDTLK